MTYLPTDFINYTQWDDPNKDGILMLYVCSNLMAILAQLLQAMFLQVESLVIIFCILSTITSTTISNNQTGFKYCQTHNTYPSFNLIFKLTAITIKLTVPIT
jgi:hypothetical protein